RMRRSADFRLSTRHGVRVGRPLIVVHYLPPESPDTHRPAAVGFTVGRSVGGAVTRNAVRRRLRHLMAARLDQLQPGSRVVVRALPRAADASSRELDAELDAALDRALRRGARG